MKRLIKDIMTGKDHSLQGDFLKPVLRALSLVYTGIVILADLLYRRGIFPSYRPERPVISVGNIMAGGTGKTPLVMLLVKYLQKNGMRPVVLTRGYMPANARTGAVSDEAMMLREDLGVVVMVGADRIAAIRNAQAIAAVDIFVLDDGFQQWRLKRDLDMVVIDALDPFGNGHVLPRGLLRESLSALARADVFILTRTDLGRDLVPGIRQQLQAIKPGCPVIETIHAPVALEAAFDGGQGGGLELLKNRIAAVCAIGAPASFEATLKAQGADIGRLFVFDDHHPYTIEDVRRIVAFCREAKISRIVTTRKDAVKLRKFKEAFQGVSLLVLKIEIKVVHGETELFSRIDQLFHP